MIKLRIVYNDGRREEFICAYMSMSPNLNDYGTPPTLYLELTDGTTRYIELADVYTINTLRSERGGE